jgi:hypothetical protein
MFEVEVTLKWLLEDTEGRRLRDYVEGIQIAKEQIFRKAKAESSASAQVIATWLLEEQGGSLMGDEVEHSKAGLERLSIRDMAAEVEEEHVYDFGYWLFSAFVHAHVVSVLSTSEEQLAKEPVLRYLFGWHADGLPALQVLSVAPAMGVRIFRYVAQATAIDLTEALDSADRSNREAIVSYFGGRVQFVNDIPAGSVALRNKRGKTLWAVHSRKRPTRRKR